MRSSSSSVCVWVGGLVVVGRFSRLAPAALVTEVATGTLRALAELAVPRQLFDTPHGRTILVERRRRLGLALAIVLAAALLVAEVPGRS